MKVDDNLNLVPGEKKDDGPGTGKEGRKEVKTCGRKLEGC